MPIAPDGALELPNCSGAAETTTSEWWSSATRDPTADSASEADASPPAADSAAIGAPFLSSPLPCPALPSSAFFFFWLKKGSLLARFTDSLLFFVVVVACVCFSVSLVQLSQKSDGGEKETDKQSLALVPTTVHRNRSSNFCLSCVQPVQL